MTNAPDADAALWPLSHPLATVEQLSTSASQLDGIPPDLERQLRYHAARLTQAAGILLRLPQTTIAEAVVILTRFYTGPEGGSFALHSIKEISAACVYHAAKTSFTPLGPRSVLNVYAYLTSALAPLSSISSNSPPTQNPPADPATYTLTDGQYLAQQPALFRTEALVLRTLGHATRVALPHALALMYLQTFALLRPTPSAPDRPQRLATRTIALLNDALLSPQRLYLTHPPSALATAAVYRAAREVGVKLSEGAWWSVCDVGREELGFLVVAMGSLEGWVRREGGEGGWWGVEDVRREVERRAEEEEGRMEEG